MNAGRNQETRSGVLSSAGIACPTTCEAESKDFQAATRTGPVLKAASSAVKGLVTRLLRDTLLLLDQEGRRQYLILAILSSISSLVQAVGVSSVGLFFALLIDGRPPKSAPQFLHGLGVPALGMLVFCLLVSGSMLSALATYYGISAAWRQYPIIASRLLRRYLKNSYEWHVNQNSSDLGRMVLVETGNIVSLLLQHMVLFFVKGTEVLVIAFLLFAVRPLVAISAGLSFFLIYFVLYKINQRYIHEQGEVQLRSNADRHRTVTEVLSGVKTVKAFAVENFFASLFHDSAVAYSRASASIQYFSLLPKHFVEVIIFGGLVGFVVFSESRGWSTSESIPLISLYAAAAVRLLPGIQQCYLSGTYINAARPSLRAVLEGLETASAPSKRRFVAADCPEALRLENVSYTYPGADKPTLSQISFSISPGEKVGIVGMTGAGKTTLVDILLGLLEPGEGRVLVREAKSEPPSCSVGYVPQTVNLIDDTIAANIALGEAPGDRCATRLRQAATAARIAEHIDSLPLGYDSQIGEQGVRLSGGQRQRLGIARALYRNPQIVVLDEASSALDAKTEQEVFNSLHREDLTLIIISHRLTILTSCTKILLVVGGRVVAQGTYDELLRNEPMFAALATSQSDPPS